MPGWQPFADNPPENVQLQGWVFVTPEEAITVEAVIDRLSPADELSLGGKDMGCAVFIDHQQGGDGTLQYDG